MNKTSVYLPDDLMEYLLAEEKAAGGKSVVVQEGLIARRAARSKELSTK